MKGIIGVNALHMMRSSPKAVDCSFCKARCYRAFIWPARQVPPPLYDNRSVFATHGSPGRCTSPTTTWSIDPSLAKRSLSRCPWCL